MQLHDGLPTLDELLALSPAIALSFVISLDGQLRGPDGSSRSLSAPNDLELLRRLRASADAVVVGRRTAELEQYGETLSVRKEFADLRKDLGLAPTPALVVIDRRGPSLSDIVDAHGPRILLEAGLTLHRVFAADISRVWLSHAPVTVGHEDATFAMPLPPLRERWLAEDYVVSRHEH